MDDADLSSPPASEPSPASSVAGPRRRWLATLAIVAIFAIISVVAGAIAATVFLLIGSEEEHPRPVREPTRAAVATRSTGLSAEARPFEVVLGWDGLTGEPSPDSYNIYRDGTRVGSAERGATSFTDDTTLPDQHYEYLVRAYHGGRLAETASVDVDTPAAPLRLARVDGTYDVSLRGITEHGFGGFPPNHSRAWRFEARCEDGPCDVVWSDLGGDGEVRLVRNERSYRGSGSSRAFVQCGPPGGDTISMKSSVVIRLKVDQANVSGDQWAATMLTGTFRHEEPAQLGCTASGATHAVRASLVP